MPIITAIEKQGPILIYYTDDSQGRCYKLDFEKGQAYGITGKLLTTTNAIVSNFSVHVSRREKVYCAASQFFADKKECPVEYYHVVESFLSYPDLIHGSFNNSVIHDIACNFGGKIPKGYITWCKEKECSCVASNSLNEFLEEQALLQWPQALRETILKIQDGMRINLASLTNCDKDLCVSLIRIINNSLKRYETATLISEITNIVYSLSNYPHLRSFLDDTKSAKVALQILEAIVEKERNDKILREEARIKDLDGMKFDRYVVKVPSTMEDFTNEGEQQQNCVGYFYHGQIASGKQLIYFLRLADTPDKSYVTCRYSITDGKTAEHRRQFNDLFTNDSLFKRIDKVIHSLLK